MWLSARFSVHVHEQTNTLPNQNRDRKGADGAGCYPCTPPTLRSAICGQDAISVQWFLVGLDGPTGRDSLAQSEGLGNGLIVVCGLKGRDRHIACNPTISMFCVSRPYRPQRIVHHTQAFGLG